MLSQALSEAHRQKHRVKLIQYFVGLIGIQHPCFNGGIVHMLPKQVPIACTLLLMLLYTMHTACNNIRMTLSWKSLPALHSRRITSEQVDATFIYVHRSATERPPQVPCNKQAITAEQRYQMTPVGFVRRVEGKVGDMGGVEACKALHLVCKATVLVAGLEQLAPNCMEALMVLMQQLPVLLPHLHQ